MGDLELEPLRGRIDGKIHGPAARFGAGRVMELDASAEAERERQLDALCLTKCEKMEQRGSLANHKTGYNCLAKVGEPHRANLRRMGYSFRSLEHRTVREISCNIIFTKRSCLTFGRLGLTQTTARKGRFRCSRGSGVRWVWAPTRSASNSWSTCTETSQRQFGLLSRLPKFTNVGTTLHKHLVGIFKPSNMMHVGDKLLQLAATNCTDGTHLNTREV